MASRLDRHTYQTTSSMSSRFWPMSSPSSLRFGIMFLNLSRKMCRSLPDRFTTSLRYCSCSLPGLLSFILQVVSRQMFPNQSPAVRRRNFTKISARSLQYHWSPNCHTWSSTQRFCRSRCGGRPNCSGIYKAQSPQYVRDCNLLQCCKHGDDTSLYSKEGHSPREGSQPSIHRLTCPQCGGSNTESLGPCMEPHL